MSISKRKREARARAAQIKANAAQKNHSTASYVVGGQIKYRLRPGVRAVREIKYARICFVYYIRVYIFTGSFKKQRIR